MFGTSQNLNGKKYARMCLVFWLQKLEPVQDKLIPTPSDMSSLLKWQF